MNDDFLVRRFGALAHPRYESDWLDVQRRAKRIDKGLGRNGGLQQRPLLLIAAALALTLVVTASALGIGDRLLGVFSGTPVSERSLSERDWYALNLVTRDPSDLGSERWLDLRLRRRGMQRDLRALGISDARLLAERDGLAFYAIGGRDSHCYSIAPAGERDRLGDITCLRGPDRFPSRAEPIHDDSVFKGRIGQPWHVWRLQGFAVNAIASVGILGEDGVVRARTPVEDNVYIRTKDLPTVPTRAVVAFDADGRRVYSFCVKIGGCEGG